MKLLIKNGEIIDGTGLKGKVGDILINNGIITELAEEILVTNDDNLKIIDATGLVVTPGFIDMHSHSDATFTCEVSNEEKLQQGVTTQVNGNCGFGLFPMVDSEGYKKEVVKDLSSVEFYIKEEEIKWGNFKEFFTYFNNTLNKGFGTNHLPLVPHSLIRSNVLGFGDKKVEKLHITQMQELLREQLNLGARGMSTGLAYAPGCFTSMEELLALCEVLKEQDKIYFSHIRDEGDMIIESVKEVIEIAEKSGCKVHISHLKAIGVKNHYKTAEIIQLISNARSQGLKITADIYPYEASSTMLSVLLPKKSRSENIDTLIENLNDKKYCLDIKDEVEYNLTNRGGSEKIMINYLGNREYNYLIGKSLKDISVIFNLGEFETILKLIIDNNNIVNGIFYAISEDGIEELLKQEFITIGSDGMLNLENKNASHPRTFGTFPKIYRKYVSELKILSLEEAVYKMTKLPANIMNLKNRGEIKIGNIADITIFDKDKIRDNSTFQNSFVYPTGINYVIVNGEIIVENSKFLSNLKGRILIDE